jgi:hypothetical protein
VVAGEPSDPYLMTGFDAKCLHLENLGEQPITVTVEIDFHGHGRFGATEVITVEPGRIATHVFPPGFSAHWVRLVSDTDSVVSGQFIYT